MNYPPRPGLETEVPPEEPPDDEPELLLFEVEGV